MCRCEKCGCDSVNLIKIIEVGEFELCICPKCGIYQEREKE